MSLQNLLEQLLQSGTSKYEHAKQSGDLGKYATGAAVGGALALLLGSKRGRSFGGKALKVGTVAALGTLAWRAYNDWQAKQQANAPASAASGTERPIETNRAVATGTDASPVTCRRVPSGTSSVSPSSGSGASSSPR